MNENYENMGLEVQENLRQDTLLEVAKKLGFSNIEDLIGRSRGFKSYSQSGHR